MLYHSISALALLALSSSVAAAPSTSTTSAASFTFSQWIEDIIANPDGDHMTPEEAVTARIAAQVSTNPLDKRANCRDDLRPANANDAAACLNNLAKAGASGQRCNVPEGQFSISMCRIGNAQVVSSKSTASAQGANCNDVARTGGLIFDGCFRADNTVRGSEICVGNNQFQVNILGV